MEHITTFLQGGYAYLLIFQIVVVSSLFLLLISMLLRRLKSEALHFSSPAAQASVEVAGAAVSTSADVEEWKSKCGALEEELQKVTKFKEDHTALLEKVKFLESKLLEYEILQEEIGSLSNLKTENEKLKKELLQVQKETDKVPADKNVEASPAPVAPPVQPETPPTQAKAETKTEPPPEAKGETKVEAKTEVPAPESAPLESKKSEAEVKAVPVVPPVKAETPPETKSEVIETPTAASSNDANAPNLDGLLAEIDALTTAQKAAPTPPNS